MREIMRRAGSTTQREFGALFGVTQGAVRKWIVNGRLPYARIKQIEELTGIPRHELAPDLFEGYVRVGSKTEENKEGAS